MLASISTWNISLLSLFDSHCFSPFPMAISFLIHSPCSAFLPVENNYGTCHRVIFFFAINVKSHDLPNSVTVTRQWKGKKGKKMHNSCIFLMFFTFFLQLSKLYFNQKIFCKTKKGSSEQCLLHIVFEESSSSYEQYFLFMKRWSYPCPHKFSLQNGSISKREKEKNFVNRVWRKLILFFELWIISESHELLKFWFLAFILDLYCFQSESIFPINLIIQKTLYSLHLKF